MTLGQGATVQSVLRELVKVLVITGANRIAIVVSQCTILRDAVDHATHWFQKRSCLFLVDDIWPTIDCKTGYLSDLRQLLRESPASRIAISKRCTAIAQCAGAFVHFGVREPLEKSSMKIFMSYATSGLSGGRQAELVSKLRSNVLKILSICGGLPIALAVTGTAVAFLARAHGDFESACQSYATRLEKKRCLLGDEDTLEGKSLNASILLSLEFLEAELLKWKARRLQFMKYSIKDLYTSLCVIKNQAWVSASVLGRLWRLSEDDAMDVMQLFCGMSLGTLQVREASSGSCRKPGIVLHDLQLEFCQMQAKYMNTSSLWHAQLLNGYVEARNHSTEETDAHLIKSLMPRPWWSNTVQEDGYIHANLSRHLLCSHNGIELAALLLDWRWIELRGRIGGVLALRSDFEILESFLLHCERSRRQPMGDVRRGFRQIFKAVQLSWGRMIKGLRVFQFHVCGHLVEFRTSNTIVDAFAMSIYNFCPKPFLLPLNSFFPELGRALVMEIPVGEACLSIAKSFIAAGSGSDIEVAKYASGEIVQHLRGHTDCVTFVAFAFESKKIVSGSRYRTIIVWKWESSGSPVHVLEGHGSFLSGIAVSNDGRRIFSTAKDKTLRVWDAIAGTQACAVLQSEAMNCVSLCGEGRKIAIGLKKGKLKVLDSITNEVVFEATEAHKRDVSCVAFSPDGTCLATGSLDKTICLWDTKTWTAPTACLEGHKKCLSCVAFSADGNRIVSSSWDGTIRLWNAKSRNCVSISPKQDSPLESVSFIGNGERIVSGSRDGIVRIWDLCLGIEVNDEIHGHSSRVRGVSISPNGLQVASASMDKTVRLWDTQTGEPIGMPMEGQTDWIFCVSFSPEGRRLVSGSRDGTMRLWDTDTQTQIGDLIEGHASSVRCVSFSFDGLRIVSGSSDMTVKIWNAETHKQVNETLRGHRHWVLSVSESADGCHIVSGDLRKRTIIWNRESRAILWKSGHGIIDGSNSAKSRTAEEYVYENYITDGDAEQVIRSCGQLTSCLWPKTFPQYTAELHSDQKLVYSHYLGKRIFLAGLEVETCRYHTERKLFAAGLSHGGVAICRLKTE